MSRASWSAHTITPDDEALRALRDAWSWLLGEAWTPALFSVWGDVFLDQDGRIFWLNTGTGEIVEVASDLDDLQTRLAGEQVDEWFLPHLVDELHQCGLRPSAGQCFTYVTYPVFAEGKYEVANIRVVAAREHFGLSGELHRQIANLPDGAQVRISVAP